MKSISAISLALIGGTQAGQVDANNLQSVDNYGFLYEPEHPQMELIVSDFGGAAPNLQKHHHHKHKDHQAGKVAVVEKETKVHKTVPIVAKRTDIKQKKHVAAAQEDEDEVGDPSDYDKAEPMNAEDIDSYTSSIIDERLGNGRSISQMMAQDEEDKKSAEFLRKQKLAKEATDLANSLKKKKAPVPVKTDADDVLEMMQKMSNEELDDDRERTNMEKEEARFHEQSQNQKDKEDKEIAKEAVEAKQAASLHQKRLAQEEKEEHEVDKQEQPKDEVKKAPVASSPYTKAISTAETSTESSEKEKLLEEQKAKSAAAQKDRAEAEEISEFEPTPVVQKKKVEAPPAVEEPKQRQRVLDFGVDDQYTHVKTTISASQESEEGDEGAWGTAAAASEAANDSLDDLAEKAEFATKLRNEKSYLAAHTAPPATTTKASVSQSLVQKPVAAPIVHQQLNEEQQWVSQKMAKSNQEKLDEEMQEVDENYDYDSAMLDRAWM